MRPTKPVKHLFAVVTIALLALVAIGFHFYMVEMEAIKKANAFCQATYIGESLQHLSLRIESSDSDKIFSHFYRSRVKYQPDSYTVNFSGAALSKHICFVELVGNKVIKFSVKNPD